MDTKLLSCDLAIKTVSDNGTFIGYGSTFNVRDSQNEIVAPGAFQKSLNQWRGLNRFPAMLWMHDPSIPIGLWIALDEDAHGLSVKGKLALRTQKGAEAYELLKMGALSGLSIGYRTIKSKFDIKQKAKILTEVELFEISLVTFPANDRARVTQVRSTPSPKSSVSPHTRCDLRAIATRLNLTARSLKQKNLHIGDKI